MNQEIKKAWVAALRSGDYQQGVGLLHYKKDGQDKYCCLGVLCELAVGGGVIPAGQLNADGQYQYNNSLYMPSSIVLDWAGLQSDDVIIHQINDTLANHNDAGRTFLEIATAIEEQL